MISKKQEFEEEVRDKIFISYFLLHISFFEKEVR